MQLKVEFSTALAHIERGHYFLPFVEGEPARLERCALAAKLCFGLPATPPADPWRAAENAGITVHGQEFFETLSEEQRYEIFDHGGTHWSAGTILGEGHAMIFLNPTHDLVRQKVTLAEELAHIVLGHPPSVIDSDTGMRTYDSDVESEAYCVGSAMVLPYQDLFNLVKSGATEAAIAQRYAVSSRFVVARVNRCGLRPMYRKRHRRTA
jgi:Zn-dependent peptidase ImmA (M78 family)